MRLCRFDDDRLGLVEGDHVRDVTAALVVVPFARWPLPPGDPVIRHLDRLRVEIERIRASAPLRALGEISLRSPVVNPTKIAAAPANYAKHLEEAKADRATFHEHQLKRIEDTGLFLKASSSLVGPADGVPLRHPERRTDHEIELVAIIGKTADRVPRQCALEYIAGYAIGLDMSVRGGEERSFRKSLDGYTVLGPWLVTADEIADPSRLDLELHVNGELRQRASTRDLVIDLAGLVEWASSYYSLHPGDLVFTGTPEGVGPIAPGDVMTARISQIGEMRVVARAAERRAS